MNAPIRESGDLAVKPQSIKAITFLKAWPTHPVLTAIHTDPVTGEKGRIETKAFPPGPIGEVDWRAVFQWVESRNGKANLYFLVNPSRVVRDNKANKDDISALIALHVDVDVRVGEDQREGIDRIIRKFHAYRLPPSLITSSGGGAQAFWLLDKPLPLDGSNDAAEDAKLYNVAIERDLDGDHCHNVDRIMRLPGTVNIPNAVKLKKGRKLALAQVLEFDPARRYPLAKFSKAITSKAKLEGATDGIDARSEKEFGTDTVGSVTSINDERLSHLPVRAKVIMEFGCIPDYQIKSGEQKDTSRSGWLLDFICECRRAGIPDSLAAGIISDRRWKVSSCVLDKPEPGREVERILARATDFVGLPDERPIVIYDDLRLPHVIDEVESKLLEISAPIFDRAGNLSQVYRQGEASVEEGIKRHHGALTIRTIPNLRLRELLMENIRFRERRHTKQGVRETDLAPPVMLAAHLAARADRRRLRELRGIIEVPTLRLDGTVLVQPGYDPKTKLLLDTGGLPYPEIPERPTKENALASLLIIKRPYRDFPFKRDDESVTGGSEARSASRSVALSSLMTAVVAPMLSAVPLHGFNAPTMGSGKTLCANIASMAVTGREAPMMAQGHNEEEDEKRLGGVLLRGDPILMLDNVRRPVMGDLMCQIITESTVQVRILGATGQVHLPAHVLILATGNNLQVAGDMSTRSLVCTIDSETERPEERRFDTNLKNWVPQHRAELVVAVLTILRAYVLAGRPWPDGVRPFGRFEQWDRTVRGALLWLGDPDPCATRADAAVMDPVRDDLTTLLSAIRQNPRLGDGNPFSAQDVITCARTSSDLMEGLTTALPSGVVTAKSISRFLKAYSGRILDGWCVRAALDGHAKAMRFRLVNVQKHCALL